MPRPIRSSYPSASASWVTSAPAASASSAIALMKEIFVARKAFAPPFTSSAVGRLHTTTGVPSAIGVAKTSRSRASAARRSTPNTSRSGCSVSSTPCASRRNSGCQASSTAVPAGASVWKRCSTRFAVPTGTVDLPTTSAGRVSSGASMSTTELT